MQNIYADGIGNINIRGNMVKIDFVTQEENVQTPEGKPVYSLSQRVVVPLEGFIQAFNLQESVINSLLERGVLKRESEQNVVGTGEAVEEPTNFANKDVSGGKKNKK